MSLRGARGLVPVALYLGCMPLWICWLFQPTVVIGFLWLVPLSFALLLPLGPISLLVDVAILFAVAVLAWAYCAWDHHRA